MLTTATLQSVSVAGSAIKMVIGQTQSDGSNYLTNDPYDITSCDRANSSVTPFVSYPATNSCPPTNNPTATSPTPATYFTTSFCSGDWIIKLSPITYVVCAGPGSPTTPSPGCDQTANSPDIQDPKLTRIQNGVATVVMDQVIGFKAGAAIWNDVQTGSGFSSPIPANVPYYNYQASTYAIAGSPSNQESWNFSLIRSVRVSILARTTPNTTYSTYHNTFDGGAYQVQGAAIVVNPRNLSMNDDQNVALQ
jgi:hypothetical protein